MEPSTTTPSTETPTNSPVLTERDITRAATNDPSLAADQFILGDRMFPIVDLDYDSYILFLSHLQPVIEALVAKVAEGTDVAIPGLDIRPSMFSAGSIISMCGKTLPEMVCIMCKQTDPTVTVELVKKLAKKPTVLANAIMRQVTQNGMIRDFSDFFGQMLAAVKTSKIIPTVT